MARRKGSRSRKQKKSLIGMARGAMYVGIPALTSYNDYVGLKAAGRSTPDAIQQTAVQWAGISPTTKKFDGQVLMNNWAPVIAWAAVDYGASKFGIYKKVGRLFRF